MGKAINESMFCADDAQDQIKEIIRGLEPFVSFCFFPSDDAFADVAGVFFE